MLMVIEYQCFGLGNSAWARGNIKESFSSVGIELNTAGVVKSHDVDKLPIFHTWSVLENIKIELSEAVSTEVFIYS